MFSQFPLHPTLLKAVAELGYNEPTAVQESVIPPALERLDLRITAETGSGKTLAYLLPTLNHLLSRERGGTGTHALILLPTRELARQVHEVAQVLARHTNLKLALICGAEPFDLQMETLAAEPDLIVATPGRLEKHLRLGSPDLSDLQTLVLDEADRMLDLGFAEDVMRIVGHCSAERQSLLCSATLGHKGLHGLGGQLLRDPETITLSSVRERHSTLHHQRLLADDHTHKLQLLIWLLTHERYERAIVFTNSRDQANYVGGALPGHGIRVGVLHGEMEQAQRNRVMSLLDEGAFRVLVATDLAGRGLDIEGVDWVINFDVPRRGEIYIHRAGRTGRAGRAGTCVTLVAPQEWNLTAGIERYLRQHFEPRLIPELKGHYTGPKKLKASGKAASDGKRKKGKKRAAAKPKRRHKRP